MRRNSITCPWDVCEFHFQNWADAVVTFLVVHKLSRKQLAAVCACYDSATLPGTVVWQFGRSLYYVVTSWLASGGLLFMNFYRTNERPLGL